MAPRPALSAFMLFMQEHRKAVSEEVRKQLGPDSRPAAGDVGKALGEKWRALSDEERKEYKERANRYAKERKEQQEQQEVGNQPREEHFDCSVQPFERSNMEF